MRLLGHAHQPPQQFVHRVMPGIGQQGARRLHLQIKITHHLPDAVMQFAANPFPLFQRRQHPLLCQYLRCALRHPLLQISHLSP